MMATMERVFLVKEPASDLRIITLPHPKTEAPMRFIVDAKGETIMEIQKGAQKYSSWFKDQSVIEEGSLYVATPIDPLFIMIWLLEKCRKKKEGQEGYFCSWDQMLEESSEFPAFRHLVFCLPHLHLICDVTGAEGEDGGQAGAFYRLNDDRLMRWLRCKVNRLVENLPMKFPNVVSSLRPGAISASYVPSSSYSQTVSRDDLLRNALSLLSDYVKPELHKSLSESFGIQAVEQKPPTQSKPQQTLSYTPSSSSTSSTASSSFARSQELVELEEQLKRQQAEAEKEAQIEARKTAAHKRLEKTDTKNMKAITSFFPVVQQKKTKD
jgi:ribonuclease H2 subunit B